MQTVEIQVHRKLSSWRWCRSCMLALRLFMTTGQFCWNIIRYPRGISVMRDYLTECRFQDFGMKVQVSLLCFHFIDKCWAYNQNNSMMNFCTLLLYPVVNITMNVNNLVMCFVLPNCNIHTGCADEDSICCQLSFSSNIQGMFNKSL